jgi:hypothetical protein
MGNDVQKSQLQRIAELALTLMGDPTPPPFLTALKVAACENEDQTHVLIKFHNAGSNTIRNITANVTELLYPGVSAWDQWNWGGGDPTDTVPDFWRPIEIKILPPGHAEVFKRKLFPAVHPAAGPLYINAAIEGTASIYKVAIDFSRVNPPEKPPKT